MSKSFPEWWKHGQRVRTASDGILTLNIAEDAEYWLTNDAGKEVSVFSADILGPASTPEACRMTTDITELALITKIKKQLENFDTVILKEAEANALVEALEKARQRIDELESKLANPVQLPHTNGYWTETEKAYEEAITLAKRQIRLAGFRCEGDE